MNATVGTWAERDEGPCERALARIEAQAKIYRTALLAIAGNRLIVATAAHHIAYAALSAAQALEEKP